MKHLAFITAVAGLGMSVQAPAQIYESAFKDTNGIEIHARLLVLCLIRHHR